jgi:hypothetical protein
MGPSHPDGSKTCFEVVDDPEAPTSLTLTPCDTRLRSRLLGARASDRRSPDRAQSRSAGAGRAHQRGHTGMTLVWAAEQTPRTSHRAVGRVASRFALSPSAFHNPFPHARISRPSREGKRACAGTFESGSDGTRTRDLRRDRPVRGWRGGRRWTRLRSVHGRLALAAERSRMVEPSASWRLLPVCCPPRRGNSRATLLGHARQE